MESYRGSSLTVNVRPKLKLEVVVEDEDKATVVEAILRHARTGEVGDGKIFVLPVEEAIRIRTGEDGESVLQAIRRRRSPPAPQPRRADCRAMAGEERITLSEAARRSGVSAAHPEALGRGQGDPGAARPLDRRRGGPGAGGGADARTRPLARGAAQGRPRGPALLRPRRGPPARSPAEEQVTVEEVARETGLEPELVERILVILGTPLERERLLDPGDVEALRHCARVLAAGFPLVAFLQLVRGLRAVDAAHRRRRGAAHPPLRPRADDPRRRARAGNGRGDRRPRRPTSCRWRRR